MESRDWIAIDAALDALERLTVSVDLPWRHAEHVGAIEACLRPLDDPKLAADQCEELRALAGRFYDANEQKRWTMEQVQTVHGAMRICVTAIGRRLAMLKKAEGDGAT